VNSLKIAVIRGKSGWGWRVGLLSVVDFKDLCWAFSWFQLDFNWFLHEVYEISFVADPSTGALQTHGLKKQQNLYSKFKFARDKYWQIQSV